VDFTVYGIAAAAALMAIMEGVKRAVPGLHDRNAWLVTVGLGVLLAVGVELATEYAVWDRWYRVVLSGLFAALAAGGLYSGVKRREE
jgi:predicted tellurium resistance membrane protein TerC